MHFDKVKKESTPEPSPTTLHHLNAKTKRQNSKSTHYPFLSSPQRFHHQPTSNPGPGAYEQMHRQRHTSDYHVVKERDQWGIGKEFMWIVSKGREPFEMNSPWKANIGPGKYDQSHGRQNIHSAWAKNARFNYELGERKVNVGPGWYGTVSNPKPQPAACSAFKSRSDKSYMDTILKQQLKLSQQKQNPELQFSSIEQEIQERKLINTLLRRQTTREDSIIKKQGSPVFLSKIARLPTPVAHQLGPGSYTLTSPAPKPKAKRVQTDSNQQLLRSSIIKKHTSSKVVGPGPGAYEVNGDALECTKVLRRPALGVILKEGRFKSSSHSDRNIQPKYYDTSGKTACFASDRLTKTINQQVQGPSGNYGVYSMLRRIQDQKESQQRLHSEQ